MPATGNDEMTEWALRYADRGWRVFPLHTIMNDGVCSCRNTQCDSPGKHPWLSGGFKVASDDPNVIRRWFGSTYQGRCNIGVATGGFSRVVVLDIDGPKGEESLKLSGDKVPETLVCLTGRGRHVYFRHPGLDMRNRTAMLPGLDVRADGGYVVAPPSRHISGTIYEWEDWSAPVAQPPAWFIDRVKQSHDKNGAMSRELADAVHGDGVIPEGMRDNAMFRIACSYRRKGLGQSEIEALLHAVNKTRCVPPLDAATVSQKAAQAAKYRLDDEQLVMDAPSWMLEKKVTELEALGVKSDTIEKVRKEAAAVIGNNRVGALDVTLIRKWNGPSRGAVFDVTVMSNGKQVCLPGLSGRDVLDYRNTIVPRAFEEGLQLPRHKGSEKLWEELLAQQADGADAVPRDPVEHPLGAALLCCVDTIRALAVTSRTEWAQSPSMRAFEDDVGGVKVICFRRSLLEDKMKHSVRDAKREHWVGAFRLLQVVHGRRIQIGENKRMMVDYMPVHLLDTDWASRWWPE